MSPRALAFPAAQLLLFAASACASRPEPAPPVEPATAAEVAAPAAPSAATVEEDEDAVTGKSLYARHCAGCHNDNGDGRGATMLQQGKQARSFAQGGFAFGNTVEAIAKTIASGIPGSSPMQSFKAVMDEDEMRMVAEYVLTLTPYKAEVKAVDSVMVVGDRAVIARGKLPAIREGLPEHPRGLMVGLPGGLSFEYRIDDVRLLAVRRGAFVDRTDWNERGGGELKPLGEIVDELEGGEPGPWMFVRVDQNYVPVEVGLSSTRVNSDGGVRIQVQPKISAPKLIDRLFVWLDPVSTAVGIAYRRSIEWEPAHEFADDGEILLCLAAWPMDVEFEVGGPPAPAAASAGNLADGWIVVRDHRGVVAHHFGSPERLRWQELDGRRAVVLSIRGGAGPNYLGAGMTSVRLDAWDDTLRDRLLQPSTGR